MAALRHYTVAVYEAEGGGFWSGGVSPSRDGRSAEPVGTGRRRGRWPTRA